MNILGVWNTDWWSRQLITSIIRSISFQGVFFVQAPQPAQLCSLSTLLVITDESTRIRRELPAWHAHGLTVIVADPNPEHRLQYYQMGIHLVHTLPLDPMLLRAQLIGLQATRPAAQVAWGEIILLPDTRSLQFHSVRLRLTPKEFTLVQLVGKSQTHLLSREQLIELLNPRKQITTGSLDTLLHRLRNKLRAKGIPLHIKARHGGVMAWAEGEP